MDTLSAATAGDDCTLPPAALSRLSFALATAALHCSPDQFPDASHLIAAVLRGGAEGELPGPDLATSLQATPPPRLRLLLLLLSSLPAALQRVPVSNARAHARACTFVASPDARQAAAAAVCVVLRAAVATACPPDDAVPDPDDAAAATAVACAAINCVSAWLRCSVMGDDGAEIGWTFPQLAAW